MFDSLKRLAVVIPAYQPDRQLVLLVHELRQKRPSQLIIVVNDGSDSTRQTIFAELIQYEVDLIHHPVNLGKGQALKTAFNHYLTVQGDNAVGVVTADADGQHTADDVLNLLDALAAKPDLLHLGVRDFALKHIPWRSKIGNSLTGFIFRNLSDSTLYDTQTGLRGIPSQLMTPVLASKLKGYELELEMLLLAAEHQIPINQISIKTIYHNKNASSHFNPLVDSMKVYWVFIRFSAFSLYCALLDIFVFMSVFFLFHQIGIAVLFGRMVTAPLNFIGNRRLTFKLKSKTMSRAAIKYALFASTLGIISYVLIVCLNKLGFSVISSKILAELMIFIVTRISIQ